MQNRPKARSEGIIAQQVGQELLLYDLRKNTAYCLNQTSALVWQSCDGQNSIDDLRVAVAAKLQFSVSEELVWLALDGLEKDDLLEESVGLSRRQAIGKMSVACLAALPLIASTLTPSPIMALSGCFTCAANYPDRCGAFSDNCSGQVNCSCTGIKGCISTNCICPNPDFAATLPSVQAFCSGRCAEQIRIGDNGAGGLIIVASGGCPVNCNDCGGGGG